jgi:HK97 family phage major capsid protein
MDYLKILEEKKALVKDLFNKAETDEDRQKYADQYEAVMEQIATEKARLAAKEEKKAAEDKAAEDAVKAAQKRAPIPDVKITEAGEYKGVNLKRAVAIAKHKAREVNENVYKLMERDYEATEKVAKHWTELVLRALQSPFPDVQKAGQVGGTDAYGGYITPTDERLEVLAYMRETSVALQDAHIEQLTTDTMTVPVEEEAVTVAFRDEGSAVTADSAKFAQRTIATKNLDAYVPASKEVVQDASQLVGILMAQFNEAIGKKVDSAVFKADADGPASGILSARCGYSQNFATDSAHFSMILEADLRGIVSKVLARPQDEARLRWYGHPSPIWNYIKALKDGDSRPLFYDTVGGDPARMVGYPIRYAYRMPSASEAATAFLAFGDLSGYWIGERLTTMSLFYDPYSDAANGNDRFFLFTRWGFDFALPNKMGRVVTGATS